MGKPLTIQLEDDERIEAFKDSLGARTKIEVIRRALDALGRELEKVVRVARWKHAVGMVRKESSRVNREFQKHSLIKKL